LGNFSLYPATYNLPVFRVAFRHAGISFFRLSSTGLRFIPHLAVWLPTPIDLGSGLNPAYPVTHEEDSSLKVTVFTPSPWGSTNLSD